MSLESWIPFRISKRTSSKIASVVVDPEQEGEKTRTIKTITQRMIKQTSAKLASVVKYDPWAKY